MFDHDVDYAEGLSQRLQIAIRNIEFARRYSMKLLSDLSEDEWFWQPAGYPTHIAWQAGHLAMSQYGLTLFRQRGRDLSVDKELMSSKFRKLFMRGTSPLCDREKHPLRQEILDVLGRVTDQMRKEIVTFQDEDMDEPLEPPHAAYATRYGALVFAADHEMLHAGQIGMLRRLMGKEPVH